MNKKVCLILLASATSHVSLLARSETGIPTLDLYEQHKQQQEDKIFHSEPSKVINTQEETKKLHEEIRSLQDANQQLKNELSNTHKELDLADQKLSEAETAHKESKAELVSENDRLKNNITEIKRTALLGTAAAFVLGYAIKSFIK